MTTNEQDARALTYLACRLRTVTHGASKWDEHGTHAVVAKLVGRNLAVTIEQVTRHAQDPAAKTPGAILRPFTPQLERRGDLPPTKGRECARHVGEFAHACRACAADRVAAVPYGHDDDQPDTTGWDPARIRAEIRTRTQPEETP